jgi:hypothetical protein
MRRLWNSKKGKIIFRSGLFALSSKLYAKRPMLLALCFMLLALCYLMYPRGASSGPYLSSAHGGQNGTITGVHRTSVSDYAAGNCVHCHEQHASIGGSEPAPNTGGALGPDIYLLLSDFVGQFDVPCFDCHIEAGYPQYQDPPDQMYVQYNYSRIAGGDTTITCPNNIGRAFGFITSDCTLSRAGNCSSSVGSSHCLANIAVFLKDKWGFSSAAANNNPCSGCHNPHRAKRNYPCSRPSAHADLTTWDVWGDDAGTSERMNIATPNYWAPKRVGGGYEPDGCLTLDCQNGSNTPNYVNLCYDCHNPTNVIWSTRLNRNLSQIDWTITGDFHGNRQRIDDGGDYSGSGEWGDLLAPYKVNGTYPKTNYLVSCTDCHEPHGSPNEFLLRPTVNGVQANSLNGGPISGGKWYYFCTACHSVTGHVAPIDPTFDCYQGGSCHKHCYGSTCSASGFF